MLGDRGERFAKKIEKKGLRNIINRGGEKKVYAHPDSDEKVVAIWHREGLIVGSGIFDEESFQRHPEMDQKERNRFKRQFYLLKVLHLLFPDNIPKTHGVGTEPRLMVREKVPHPEPYFDSVDRLLKWQPFAWKLRHLGLPVDTKGPNAEKNGTTGAPVYLDTFLINAKRSPENSTLKYKEEKTILTSLRQAVRDSNLNESDKTSANLYLDRFEHLLENPNASKD